MGTVSVFTTGNYHSCQLRCTEWQQPGSKYSLPNQQKINHNGLGRKLSNYTWKPVWSRDHDQTPPNKCVKHNISMYGVSESHSGIDHITIDHYDLSSLDLAESTRSLVACHSVHLSWQWQFPVVKTLTAPIGFLRFRSMVYPRVTLRHSIHTNIMFYTLFGGEFDQTGFHVQFEIFLPNPL